MRRIIVVGGGLAGLGASFALQEAGFAVDLYEKADIGAGASGVASGLMHPYPGKKMHRSHEAKQALDASFAILRAAQPFANQPLWIEKPILRKAIHEEDTLRFQELAKAHEDLEYCSKENVLRILSGVTVHVPQYLYALREFLKKQGVRFFHEEFEKKEKDQTIVWATGKDIRKLSEVGHLPLQWIKGQVLLLNAPSVQSSTIGDGYLALSQEKGVVHCGSTYEHHFESTEPNLEVALKKMGHRIIKFYPSFSSSNVIGCNSGVRVSRKGGYLPFVEKIKEHEWILTGFGSRGLLYHALYGKKLTQSILHEKG